MIFRRKEEEKKGADACILCRLCDAGSSYPLTLDERRSLRHAVWLAKNRRESAWLYAAMLNGVGEKACPIGIAIDDAIIDARRRMVEKGMETKENREFFAKLRQGKNPYA